MPEEKRMKISPRLQSLFLLSVSLIASLILCEIGLRVLTPFPVNKSSNKIDDAVLGYRMNSKLAGVDSSGFRNPSENQRVLAAIGDSHTFGFNVTPEDTWPAVLQRNSGIPIYNFGVGGYGIYSYHALMRQHVAPEYTGALIALYIPNDFSERSHCLIDRGSSFWRQETKRLSLTMPKCWGLDKAYKSRRIGHFIKYETAIGSAFKHLIIDRVRAFGRIRVKKTIEVPYAQESVRLRRVSALTRSMDFDRDEIRTIWSDFLKMIADWSNTAREKKLLLGMIIIPSKQRVLLEYAKHRGEDQPSERLKEALQKEVELEAKIIEHARNLGIPTDSAIGPMLNAKELALQKGMPLYPPGNGHPNVVGYAAYARSAHDLLRKICDDHMDNPICSQAWARRAEQISK